MATAATGREAVRAAVTQAPDVLVLDVQMPDLNGVEAAAEIARAAPAVAVLMLTMFDDDDSVFAAMRAGARGYLLKGAGQDEIVGAIRAVAAGQVIFGPVSPAGCCASWQAGQAGRAVPGAHHPGTPGARAACRGVVHDSCWCPVGARHQDRPQPCVGDLREARSQRTGRGGAASSSRRSGRMTMTQPGTWSVSANGAVPPEAPRSEIMQMHVAYSLVGQ